MHTELELLAATVAVMNKEGWPTEWQGGEPLLLAEGNLALAALKAGYALAAPAATASTLGEPEPDKQWVIVSLKEGRGLPYWRANGAGYADSITQAGYYTYAEARKHTAGTHGDDEKYHIDDPALQQLISQQSYIRGKELALWLENAQLRAAHPATTVAAGGAVEAGGEKWKAARKAARSLEERLREGARHSMTRTDAANEVALLLPYLRHLEGRAAPTDATSHREEVQGA